MNRQDVITAMGVEGLPPLPSGHLLLTGKIQKFGKGKKAWYKLRALRLDNGDEVIVGHFGLWRGQDPGTVAVTLEGGSFSAEARAEAERKHAELQRQEEARRVRVAELAAGRARRQWAQAAAVGQDAQVAYLLRKKIPGDGARVDESGQLLVPARRYAGGKPELVSVQKIGADGEKRFNSGADMAGAACLLGRIDASTRLIGLGEGYATLQSARLATDSAFPAMVAFHAGNLLAVARQLRKDFPDATILLLADDDWQLEHRFRRDLLEDWGVAEAPAIDGADHTVIGTDGAACVVRATWRTDSTGTPYIEADIRMGRRLRMIKFENAGLSRAQAAAKDIGNAQVAFPIFAARGDNKWTDWNDLHVEQSLDDVRAQLLPVVERLLAGGAPVPDSGLPAPAPGPAATISPAPPLEDDPVGISVPTPEQLVAHFALIYQTTDIYDALRKQKMKRSAFVAWVGKEAAAAWERDPKRRTVLRETLQLAGRDGNGGAGGRLQEMLDHITLLRGTETVWDGVGQQVMSLGAVRADYTPDLTTKWQEHALRRTIEAKNLLFDPTQTADPETTVNIFLGWPLKPKENAALVQPILALLCSLCSAEDNVDECVEWILRWLAFPLQNPGAKMATALLVFGEKQGTGKSLFFQDVMAPIYGDYGTVASQHQLDSSFTAWRSRKLFVLFEEVLSRDDKYSHNGTLKYMITGKDMSINEKNLPERKERNHMNAAFLSNEPQPIPIELEDRRFMVIEARQKQPKEFYDQVVAAIQAGAIQAFYHFLLNFPLDGFNEHTKPLMTLAKERVIEFGLNGWMAFHRAWKDGYLDAPYCTCLTEDLYIIYKRWCDKSGEKPLSLTKFSGLIGGREHKVKRSVAVDNKQARDRMIYEISVPGDARNRNEQINDFRKQADVRAHSMLNGAG